MRSITAAPVTMISACAAIENATAFAVPTPPSARIAAPAPACVAAPAGAIGRAADAADATRNASASTYEPGIDRALRSRKTAKPRRLHETETKSQAAHASFVQCVCSASQRPTPRRVTDGRRALRGEEAATAAAAIPAAATTAKPARVVQWLDPAAATDAIGVRAALSSIPSTSRLRPTVPIPAFVPG